MSVEANVERQQQNYNNINRNQNVTCVHEVRRRRSLSPSPSAISLPSSPLCPSIPLSHVPRQQEEQRIIQLSDNASRQGQQVQIPPSIASAAIVTATGSTSVSTIRPMLYSSGSVDLLTKPSLTTTFTLPLNRESMHIRENNQQLYNANNGVATTPDALTTIISTNNIQSRATNVNEISLEHVMPGIYLSKDFINWHTEQLHSLQFTHIIIIDKHIQELYYPTMQNPQQQQQQQQPQQLGQKSFRRNHFINDAVIALEDEDTHRDYYLHNIDIETTIMNTSSLNFGADFHVIDLNFGEKSYLANVLPNCYRAVKFMDKALERNGKILVIDCNGGEQKCLTIVIAYLMFKHNIKFRVAFDRVKDFYVKADLDRFYISQLYEYEPIVQVQRAQLRGHSCSRALHAAILKRKNISDETEGNLINNNNEKCNYNDGFAPIKDTGNYSNSKNKNSSTTVCHSNYAKDSIRHSTTHLLGDYFNPLNDFNTTRKCKNEHRGEYDADKEECKNFEMLELDKTVTAVAYLTKMARVNDSCSGGNGRRNVEHAERIIKGNNHCWNFGDDYIME